MIFRKTPPDWRVWKHAAKLSAEEVVALTMNFCPKTIKEILCVVAEGGGSPEMFSLVALDTGIDTKEFQERLLMFELSHEPGPATIDLAMLATRFEWEDIPVELTNLATPARPEAAGTPLATTEATPKPKAAIEPSKRERQIQAIVEVALAQGFDVLRIPRGGKPTIKAQCMKTQPSLFGAGPDPFKEAWQEALNQKRVRTEDHERYVK